MFELKREKVVRPYEAIVMLDPSATQEEQKSLFQKNKSIIEGFSGEMNHVDTWGTRKLGNPIEKLTRAVYFHCTFKSEPEAINELERTMKINDKVLRVVHTRLPDGTSLPKFVEEFKQALIERKEKEAKRLAAKADKRRAPRS